MTNLYKYFKENLKNHNGILINTPHAEYKFTQIDLITSHLAIILQGLGIRPGERLAAFIGKSEYNVFLYLACLRSGIIYLPLNNSYTDDELIYFFKDADPAIIVCDPSYENRMLNLANSKRVLIKTFGKEGKGSFDCQIGKDNWAEHNIYHSAPEDTAVILYTSGTTGKPKGAMITHHGLATNALDLVNMWSINKKDSILHMLPLFHVHGLFFALNTALLAGAKIILLPKFEPDLFFQFLSSATVFMGVPTYYTRLLKDPRLTQDVCQHLRLFICGSAPLLPGTFNEFEMKTAKTILERYGMTETGIITSNPVEGVRKVGTVGIPLPNMCVRIVDSNNKPVTKNHVGNIQVKSRSLFSGYWLMPEKTKEDFTIDNYFKTGDLGMMDDDGYVSIVGRSKDMVITGGLNVFPKEIETTIDEIEGVTESAVIGVMHPDFGEAVVAVVCVNQSKVDENQILHKIKQHHAGYKCPKKVIFVDALPKNTMGKVQKNKLREKFSSLFAE